MLRVRVSLGLHVKFSDTFYLILVTPLIYKHVNSKFPNKDVISSKPSELRELIYLYYDNNHSTHKQIFIEDVQFRKHSKMMEKLNLLCFTKYEAQQHDIFLGYLIRNKIYKSTKKTMYHVNHTPHIR